MRVMVSANMNMMVSLIQVLALAANMLGELSALIQEALDSRQQVCQFQATVC